MAHPNEYAWPPGVDLAAAAHKVEEWSGWPHIWCETCGGPEAVVEQSDEQSGYEEQARTWLVRRLECGHEDCVPTDPSTGAILNPGGGA